MSATDDAADDREVREEIQKFIYKNPLTALASNLGHWSVKRLKRQMRGGRQTVRTLDLCCGLGHNAEFANDFEQFTGLDHNENFVAAARKSFPQHVFVQGSVLGDTWGLPEHAFDFITANQALEHFTNEDLRVMFRNIARHLAPDGAFIYVIPLDDSFAINLGRKLTSERYMKKKFRDLDYGKWLKNREHINDYANIKREVQRAFRLEREVFLPFNVPFVHVNLYNVGVCRAK